MHEWETLRLEPLPSRGAHRCSLAPSFSNSTSFWASRCLPPPTPHPPPPLSLCLFVSVLCCLSPLCLGLFPSLNPPHCPPPPASLSLSPTAAPVVWTSSAPFCPDDLTSPPHTCTHALTVTHKYTHTHTRTRLCLGFTLNMKGPRPSPALPGQVPGRGRSRPGLQKADSAQNAPGPHPAWSLHSSPSNPFPSTALPSPPDSYVRAPLSPPRDGLAITTVPNLPLCLLQSLPALVWKLET